MSNKSVIKSVRISPTSDKRLEILDIDFSKLVEETLENLFRKKFFEEIDSEIKKVEDGLKELKNLREEMNPVPKTAEEIDYLRETKEILERKPEFLKSRSKKYSNDFDKVLLNEEEFKKLLKGVKK